MILINNLIITRIKMKIINNTLQKYLFGILFAVFLVYPKAYSQIPGISPEMLTQFSQMSASERREMARRYGVDLEDIGIIDELGIDDGLGSQGVELKQQSKEILIDRIIESESNRSEVEAYRNNNITPIFSRDYQSLEKLPTYGQFLFDGKYSTFAPVDNAPVPNNYIIGTGDSLRILMYGIEDSEIILVVNREGSINFPELGNISISGMTFPDAQKYIRDRVSKQLIGTEISISMGKLKSINVFITGEGKVPGSYSVSGLSTVSQLLFVAGGVSDIGSLRNIEVKRNGNTVSNFDLYDLLTRGNVEDDLRLQSGDVVFIPPIKKSIYIDGAIRRPGKYELKEDETISDLINISGGFKSRAFLKKIYKALESISGIFYRL